MCPISLFKDKFRPQSVREREAFVRVADKAFETVFHFAQTSWTSRITQKPWEHTTSDHTSGTSDRFEASSSVALTSEVGDP